MKKLLYISLVSLSFSCQRNEEASVWDDFYRVPYVISENEVRISAIIDSRNILYQGQVNEKEAYEINNLSAITNSFISLPPPPSYSTKDYGSGYGNINIIFYKDKVYAHTRNLMFFCRSYGSLPPEDLIDFLYLEPGDIREVSTDSLSFIDIRKSRLNALDSTRHTVIVSSLSDTIINPSFNIIVDSLRKINPLFYIRRITEEEYHVLDAKIKKVKYDPRNYTWVMNYGFVPPLQ